MKNIGYLTCFFLFTGCIDFRISDDEAANELTETGVPIKFADLTIGDRNIHYVYSDQGKEALAVFIHGSPGSWNAFIDFFKADTLLRKVDILAVDRPGFGQSNYGNAEPSMEKQAHYMNEVTKLFPHKKKILIGHSLGGPVIARMAMDYPEDYSSLVLVAASIDPTMEKDEWYRVAIKSSIGSHVTPRDFKVSNDEIVPLKEELEKMIPLWDKIKIPSVVIHGTKDSLVPVENVDFARRMLPDSLVEVRLLEGLYHFIPWTHPEIINGAISQLVIAPHIYP